MEPGAKQPLGWFLIPTTAKQRSKLERLLEEFGISRASVRRSDAADGPSALGHSVPPDGQAYQRLSFGVSPEGTLH
jgi:hypothetical protein